MSLESGNYISDLVATNPTGTDPKSQGDDHLRLIKSVLKNSFPGLDAPAKLRESASVKDFGAKGDGTTDDTVAIQAALDAMTDGSSLSFPDGVYKFTSVTVLNKNDVIIEGPGQLAGGLVISSSNRVVVQNLSFNRGRPTAGVNAIELDTAKVCSIRGVTFQGVDKCVYVRPVAVFQHTHRTLITNCITKIAEESLYSETEINDPPYVYYNQGYPNYFFYADNTGGSNPVQYQNGDTTITDNHFILASICHVYGLGQDGLVIGNNSFYHPGRFYESPIKTQCIYVKKGSWLIVNGNEIFEAGYQGIKFDNISNVSITGNIIAWCGQRDYTQGQGILITPETIGLADPYTQSSITGNLIRIPTGEGIMLSGACNYVSITGNSITTPGATSEYYGSGTPTNRYGLFVDRASAFVTAAGNITSVGFNIMEKSESTFNSSSSPWLTGPFRSSNVSEIGTDDCIPAGNVTATGAVDCLGYNRFNVYISGGGFVDAIENGSQGQMLTFYNGGEGFTLLHGPTIKLAGESSALIAYTHSITLQNISGIWYEISRT